MNEHVFHIFDQGEVKVLRIKHLQADSGMAMPTYAVIESSLEGESLEQTLWSEPATPIPNYHGANSEERSKFVAVGRAYLQRKRSCGGTLPKKNWYQTPPVSDLGIQAEQTVPKVKEVAELLLQLHDVGIGAVTLDELVVNSDQSIEQLLRCIANLKRELAVDLAGSHRDSRAFRVVDAQRLRNALFNLGWLPPCEYFKEISKEQRPSEPFVFVAMPLDPEIVPEDIFTEVIRPVAKSFGREAIKANLPAVPNKIDNRIYTLVRRCELAIVDITGQKFNVGYELGMGHAYNKRTIIIRRKTSEKRPFDIQDHDIDDYSSHDDLRQILENRFKAMFRPPKGGESKSA